MIKCVIAGSRVFTRWKEIYPIIDYFNQFLNIDEVVSGGARGVDRIGEHWAEDNFIEVKQFIPDWNGLGKKAGIVRNEEMAKYANAAIIIWDGESRGTKNMIENALKYGLKLYVVTKKAD